MSADEESGAIGSLVYSRKDGPITDISGIRDKRVGVEQSVCVGAFQLAFEVT